MQKNKQKTIIHAQSSSANSAKGGKDHFLGVMFPHLLSNQCVITTHVIIAIIVVIIAIVIISNIIIIVIIIMQQC